MMKQTTRAAVHEERRREARCGDLGFTRGHDLAGHLISLVTGSPFTHVKVCLGGGLCVEAVPPRVRVAVLDGSETIVAVPYGVTPEEDAAGREEARRRALAYRGHRYAFVAYLSYLLMLCRVPLVVAWRGEVDCAQLAARAVGRGIEQQDVSPASLLLAVVQLTHQQPLQVAQRGA